MEVNGHLYNQAALPPTPRKRAPDIHLIGGWDMVSRKIPSPRRKSNPDHPIVQPVAQSLYRLSYHGFHLSLFLDELRHWSSHFERVTVDYYHIFNATLVPF
jgi:hypothetical protein